MNLLCASFAKITPDHSKKVSISTIQKISNYFTFIWLTGDEEGFIIAYEYLIMENQKNIQSLILKNF